eukprot:g6218.t1
MKITLSLLAFLALSVAAVHADVGLNLIQGTWTAKVKNADVPLMTPNGINGICRDALPAECEAEIPLGDEELTINGSTIRFWYTSTPGILTIEQAAEAMPTCAALGYYPVEFGVGVEHGEIDSYNRLSGHLVFQDARTPDGYKCVFVKYHLGPKGPYVEFTQHVKFFGTMEQLITTGPDFKCSDPPTGCKAIISENVGDFEFKNQFTLSCSAGACMDMETVLKSTCKALELD